MKGIVGRAVWRVLRVSLGVAPEREMLEIGGSTCCDEIQADEMTQNPLGNIPQTNSGCRPNAPANLRASQIECERSELPKIARQLQRSSASRSMTCAFKVHADHDGTLKTEASYFVSGPVPLRVLLSSRAPLRRWFRQCGSAVIDARRPVVMAQ